MDLPDKSQDYVKTIYDILERTGEPASLKDIATAVGAKTPTASEAIKRLAGKGLIAHTPYSGIELTQQGRELALAMVRRHRLIEMFLVEKLGLSWSEVHEEADLLEHAVSDKILDRIDAILGSPTRDPHGDPIPTADGRVENLSTLRMSEVGTPATVIVEQIHDGDPALLEFLGKRGIVPGAEVVLEEPAVAGIATVSVSEVEVALAEAVLSQIRVILP